MEVDFGFVTAENRNTLLYGRFQDALVAFLDTVDPTGFECVILGGSFVKNRLHEGSDLDLVFVLPEGSPESQSFQETRIQGVPIQRLQFTGQQLRDSFAWESQGMMRQRSSLLASGVVVAGNLERGRELIREAERCFHGPVPPVGLENARCMVNFIDAQVPGPLEALFARSRPGFMISLNGMMDRYFQLLHQMNSRTLPREADIDLELSSIPDAECGRLFCQVLVEGDAEKKKAAFFELSALVRDRLKAYVAVHDPGAAT